MPPSTHGPEHALAAVLALGLRADFPGRESAALQFAELVLDVTGPALRVANGEAAQDALAEIELCAMQLDVYSWDGAPGWDEVLARGLGPGRRPSSAHDPVAGLGAESSRDAQRMDCERRARDEAARFLSLAKEAAVRADAGLLRSVHASLLRLTALSALHPLLALPEDLRAGALPAPSAAALEREMDERAASGSDFASAQQEWQVRLEADNPEVRVPAFGPFFAGLSQALRLSVALRALRDAARAEKVASDLEPADLEPLVGAAGAWQPVRWKELRAGIPAAWTTELFPEVQPLAGLPAVAGHCEAALDVAGRLWAAKSLSTTAFAALACALFARSACALAAVDEM
ncbi:MAG: hypothetical protein ACJ78V_00290 [Myxococcales bacterium]